MESDAARWRRFRIEVATVRARNEGVPVPRIEAAVRDALIGVRAARRRIVKDRKLGHR